MATTLVLEYTDKVREALQASPDAMSVEEVSQEVKCSENIARRALELLVYTGKASVTKRQSEGKRGTAPNVYSAVGQ